MLMRGVAGRGRANTLPGLDVSQHTQPSNSEGSLTVKIIKFAMRWKGLSFLSDKVG